MSKLSCKEFCRKTKQLKDSKFCTGLCSNIDGKLVFDCEINLKSSSSEANNFHTCYFWDIGMKDNCFHCPLECKENKNPTVLRAKSAMKNISDIMKSFEPIISMGGIDPSLFTKAKESMNASKINTNNSAEVDDAIKIANYARDIVNNALSGGNINIVEFKKIKEDIERKYKK